MTSNNFKKTPLQGRQIKRAVPVHRHSLVIEGNVTRHLLVKPYLLLGERERYGYAVRTRTDYSPLCSRPATHVFLKEPTLGFRKWCKIMQCVAFLPLDLFLRLPLLLYKYLSALLQHAICY